MLVTGFLKFEPPFFEHRVSIRASSPIHAGSNGLRSVTSIKTLEDLHAGFGR